MRLRTTLVTLVLCPWLGLFPALAVAQTVEITPLAAPDAFSTPGRNTGLGPDLWRGASAKTLREVLPKLDKPLTPAAAALARRVLATGAPGPEGIGDAPALAGQRAQALIAQGDPAAAAELLARAPGVDRTPELAQPAAEAALLAGDDARACSVSDRLGEGREAAYWMRLRAYCQFKAGQTAAAQLTLDLAQAQAKDATFARLMGAALNGGDPGAPADRNGLDVALSRTLGLATVGRVEPGPARWAVDPGTSLTGPAAAAVAKGDLAAATASRAVLTQELAGPLDLALLDALLAAAAGRPDGPTLDRLVERGSTGEAKARARAQSAALIFAALGSPLGPQARGELAGFSGGESKAPAGRLLALDLAADQKLTGETAMVALWISAEAGKDGPTAADRARIVRALRWAGLAADAQAYAVEGLLALR